MNEETARFLASYLIDHENEFTIWDGINEEAVLDSVNLAETILKFFKELK